LVVRKPDLKQEYTEQVIDLNVSMDGHGGGDIGLTEDFVRVISGEQPSISSTALEDSMYGHLIGFRADTAMEEKRVTDIPKL
jgi:hypothetical protein